MLGTIQAFDGAGEDGTTLYVLERPGEKPLSAHWPHPLYEVCPDAVMLPSYGFEINHSEPTLLPYEPAVAARPTWEPIHLSDRQVAAAESLKTFHLRCEDCGKKIEPGDYVPLDLFRPQRGSSGKYVWDATKEKWVRRPAQGPRKRARRNGRRFRVWDLCSHCAEQALLERGYDGLARLRKPKRGGRPRLLTDDELRTLHKVYMEYGLTRRELARRLLETREKGSLQGYEQALYYGWKKLRLKSVGRSEALRRAHKLHGPWSPPKCSEDGCHLWGDLVTGKCVNHREAA